MTATAATRSDEGTRPPIRRAGVPWRVDVTFHPPLERLAQLLADALDVPLVAVTVFESPTNRLGASAGDSRLIRWHDGLETVDDRPCTHVSTTGKELFIRDGVARRFRGFGVDAPVRAFGGVPITGCHGTPLGVVAAMDRSPRLWTKRERRVLAESAALVAAEIDQWRSQRKACGADVDRLTMLADAIQHSVWSTDATGAHDYANARWIEYTHQVPEPETPNAWVDLVHPDDRERVARVWQHAHARGEPFEAEYRLRRSDGAYRWHLSRGNPTRDADGRIVRWFGTATDIDDLKQTIVALRESERRFRALAEGIKEVFWLTDGDRRVLYISPAYEDVWGRSRDALFADNRDFLNGIHPDDRPRMIERMQAEDEGYTVEYRVVRPDGSIRWIADRAFPIRDEHGRVINVAGFAEDITDRRKMEQELGFNAQLLKSLQQAIVSTDTRGRVLTWNGRAEAIYGWSAAEVIGRDVREFIPEDDVPEVDAQLNRLAAGDVSISERRVRHKDGRIIWVAVSSAPVRDSSGQVVQFVGTTTDITARRALEDQLQQAQKMEAVGRLAGGVAHDFNNMLTVIGAHVEFLAESVGDTEGRDDLDQIARAAKRAAGLTRQLLAFSRKQVLDRHVVSPNTILSDLEKMLSRLIGEDIDLFVSLHPDTPKVFADQGQIEQAIMNLVVNARDAMPNGGVLRLQTRPVTVTEQMVARHTDVKPGAYAALVVSDSGTGMSDEVLERIFEPFFTTKEAGRGTGLGLAMVYGIVRQSGGFIEVQSQPGKGTTFTIYLPMTDAETVGDATSEDTSDGQRGTETILLVEDEDQVRSVARRMLSTYGYHVIEARHGGEALAFLDRSAEPVDLIVTDAVMPRVSGFDLIRRVRERFASVPVVLVTGYTDDHLVSADELDKQTLFLQKPFSVDRLIRIVRQALDRHAN